MVSPQIVDFLKAAHEFVTRFGLIDLVLMTLVLIGLLRGYHKGFSTLFGHLVQLVFITTITLEYTDTIRSYFPITSPVVGLIVQLAVFLVLTFVCYRVSKLVLQGLTKILTIRFSEIIEKMGGMLTGIAFFVLLLSFISYFLLLFPGNWMRESYEKYNLSGPFIVQLTSRVHQVVRQVIPGPLRSLKASHTSRVSSS